MNTLTRLCLFFLFALGLSADFVDSRHVSLENAKYDASSQLIEEKKDNKFYSVEKAFDGRIETAWCAATGKSVGESVEVALDKPVWSTALLIVNGAAYSRKNYFENNRLKTAKIEYWDKKGGKKELIHKFHVDSGCGYPGGSKEDYSEVLAECKNLKDERRAKCLKELSYCHLDEYDGGGEKIKIKPTCIKRIKITIQEIKKGAKFDDTCIAEIQSVHQINDDRRPTDKDVPKSCR